jgi:predicted RNase H-like HicB family nuclease
MKYPVVVHQSEYGYDVHCPFLPGCHSQGDTLEEALAMISEEEKGSLYEVRLC